jgi:glycosyltransferase involved in cell wall biosynthesis
MSSVSEEISENLSQFFNFPFFVVPNFPSSLLINETARNSRNEIQFVHHGMGRKNRGIETLIKAFAKVPSHVRLQLMLRTGFLFRMKIAALIIFHGLQDRVRLVQPVKYADLLFKLREFDASIVPGSDATDHDLYALPNKLFESIQARLPLIVGPNPSVANIVLKYNVGLVAKDWNAESFANEINRILPLLSKHDFQKNLEVAALELNSAVIETELASQIKWVCG